jgi:hypothetical protein
VGPPPAAVEATTRMTYEQSRGSCHDATTSVIEMATYVQVVCERAVFAGD